MKPDKIVRALRDRAKPRKPHICPGSVWLGHLVTDDLSNDAADLIETLRNELCIKCGLYKTAHEGSCDGCGWHRKGE